MVIRTKSQMSGRGKRRAKAAKNQIMEIVARRLASGVEVPAPLLEYVKTGKLPEDVRQDARKKEMLKVSRRLNRLRKGDFYKSDEWREVRYQAIMIHGGCCQACGTRATEEIPIHVDHIKPRSKYPHLALDINNLQVLCECCNMGKSNVYDTDWRAS
jgi:5-methylcytosine-specific restriction endonuclease McrA